MLTNQDRIYELFMELVPDSGQADCLAGELVRAACRLGFRFRDHREHLGIGQGRETCNPPGRFLFFNTPQEIKDLIREMWGLWDRDAYRDSLEILLQWVADYVDASPELLETPTDDMWDYTIPERDTWGPDMDEEEVEDEEYYDPMDDLEQLLEENGLELLQNRGDPDGLESALTEDPELEDEEDW